MFIPTRVGFKYDRLHVTPVICQEKELTAAQREDLAPETTPSTELGVDENVAFKSPADEESDCVVPFLQVPCPFSLSLSDDLVDLEEDLEASEGGQAAPEGGQADPEGGQAAPEGDREVSLVRENALHISVGLVYKCTCGRIVFIWFCVNNVSIVMC